MPTLNLSIRPEYFRLPSKGVDPYFGLSRAFYYNLDASGKVLLVRVRNKGSQRGVTLVNYEAMSSFLAKVACGSVSSPNEVLATARPPQTPSAGNAHRLAQSHADELELMRKLAPKLLYDLIQTISDLEEMVQAAPHLTENSRKMADSPKAH